MSKIALDIIDDYTVDRDSLAFNELEKLFNIKYSILSQYAVNTKNICILKLSNNKLFQFAAGLSNDDIEVLQLTESSFRPLCSLKGHSKTLTEVVYSPTDDHLLYSAGNDGVIKLWDTRTGKCVLEFTEDSVQRSYECADVSSDGRVICAGSALCQDEAFLVFWDKRAPAPLGGYWNSHTDDITQVKFHKTQKETLVTSSMDGLINVFNILEESEDDALTYSLNMNDSADRITWIDDKTISCITQSNDLHICNIKSGEVVLGFDREKISRSIKRVRGDDCYLVDVVLCDDGPQLVAGSYADDAGCVLRGARFCSQRGRLQPRAMFEGNPQHVRCALSATGDNQNQHIVTAGEEGLINVWKENKL